MSSRKSSHVDLALSTELFRDQPQKFYCHQYFVYDDKKGGVAGVIHSLFVIDEEATIFDYARLLPNDACFGTEMTLTSAASDAYLDSQFSSRSSVLLESARRSK